MSLVKKAKEFNALANSRKDWMVITSEMEELAVAYANGDVSISDAARVIGCQVSRAYTVVARALRGYASKNPIVYKTKKKK